MNTRTGRRCAPLWASPWACLCACLFAVACGGAQAKTTTPDPEPAAEASPDPRVMARPVPVGECVEGELDDEGVKEVHAPNAGFSYVVVEDAEWRCDQIRTVITLGGGVVFILTTFQPMEQSDRGLIMQTAVSALSAEARQFDENADMLPQRAVTAGEEQHPGYCGGADYTDEGNRWRTLACTFSAEDADGRWHLFSIVLSDSVANFESGEFDQPQILNNLVDGWYPEGLAEAQGTDDG